METSHDLIINYQSLQSKFSVFFQKPYTHTKLSNCFFVCLFLYYCIQQWLFDFCTKDTHIPSLTNTSFKQASLLCILPIYTNHSPSFTGPPAQTAAFTCNSSNLTTAAKAKVQQHQWQTFTLRITNSSCSMNQKEITCKTSQFAFLSFQTRNRISNYSRS